MSHPSCSQCPPAVPPDPHPDRQAKRHHDLPLYVVAPSTTVDLAMPSGAGIPIEERDPAEVTARFAARNPAFDVTPAELIAAIVTESGVHRAPFQQSLAGAVAA